MKIKTLVRNTALAVVCLVIFVPSLVYAFPSLVGVDNSYTVLSGSMKPTLNPGDIILVKQVPPVKLEKNDIVTFKTETGVLTHRIYRKENENDVYLFKTKGDANEDPDPGWTETSQIIGKTELIIPLGHLYSPYGYLIAFLIPCLLLMAKQIDHILSLIKRKSKRELRIWRRMDHPVLDTSSMLLLTILITSSIWLVAPYFQVGSFSYFSDQEWTSASFTAGQWTSTVNVDIHPDTLNLKSHGRWITAYVNLSSLEGYFVYDVAEDTLYLEEIPMEWGKIQGEEVYMAKFERTKVIEYLIGTGCVGGESVTLTLSGEFTDGSSFQGTDVINLVQDGK